MNIKYFIKKANEIYGDKYDYSLVEYKGIYSMVKIICKKHGVFHKTPDKHLHQKSGCSECANEIKRIDSVDTIFDFKKKANFKHSDKYDYSKVNYINSKTKVEIICPEHGSFWQIPNSHLMVNGCNKCANIIKRNSMLMDEGKFIKKSKQIHNQKYDYQLVDYKNIRNKVKIECVVHGIFEQKPYVHLRGQGCPKCKSIISKPEIEVQDFIKSLGFKIQCNNRKILNGKELDIFIPSLNKAIEFNGTYWHYDKANPNCKPSCYHSTKSKLCKSLNINLLHIREDLWKKDKEKMKKVIHKFLKL